MATLLHEWRSEDIAGANNDPISSWPAHVGGINIGDTSGSTRPLLKTAITPTGKNVLRFDGVDDSMDLYPNNLITGSKHFFIVAAYRPGAAAASNPLVYIDANNKAYDGDGNGSFDTASNVTQIRRDGSVTSVIALSGQFCLYEIVLTTGLGGAVGMNLASGGFGAGAWDFAYVGIYDAEVTGSPLTTIRSTLGSTYFTTPPTITTTSLPNGTVSELYSQTLAATGGTGALTWAVSVGALPAGLSLNTSTGVISGTPTTAGVFNFTVSATDTISASDTQALTITVDPAPTSGFKIKIDGVDVFTANSPTKTIDGLTPGLHSAQIADFTAAGVGAYSDPLLFYVFNEILIRINAGGPAVSPFVAEEQFIANGSATGSTAAAQDISDVANVPENVFKTYRIFGGSGGQQPSYQITQTSALIPLVASKNYEVLCHFSETNTGHVLGTSVMIVKFGDADVNVATTYAPIDDDAFLNQEQFDTYERAGAYNKGYTRRYLVPANGSGIIYMHVTNEVNGASADVKIAAVEVREARPVANFTATPGANQTAPVVFADTSTGFPTRWNWDFGDGQTSKAQNPSHTYSSAGTYNVTLTASNRFGSMSKTIAVTVPSLSALTATPSSLPTATRGSAYSQAISATGGTAPYTAEIITEDADELRLVSNSTSPTYSTVVGISDPTTYRYFAERRGGLPSGLSLVGNTLTSAGMSPSPVTVVLGGDSRNHGNFETYGENTTAPKLARLLGPFVRVYATAIPGWKLSDVQGAFSTHEAPLLAHADTKKVYILECGTNDMGSTTLADMQTQTASIFAAAKATGARVIACTVALGWYWGGAGLTKIQDYNTWLQSGIANVDAVIDMNADALIGPSAHFAYRAIDGNHFTPLGYVRRAILYKAAIDSLANTGSGSTSAGYVFRAKVRDSLGNAVMKDYTLTIS